MTSGQKTNPTKHAESVILHHAIAEIPNPPEDMCEVAKLEWYEVWSYLVQMKMATSVDFSVVIMYCNEFAMYKEAVKELKKDTIEIAPTSGYKMPSPWVSIKNQCISNILKISAEYGFTPSARAKLKLSKPKESPKSKLSNLLNG